MKALKRLTSMILTLGVMFTMGTASVFATDVKPSTTNEVYFVANQDGIVKVNEAQYNEITGGVPLQTVVTRDNLQVQPRIETRSIYGEINEVNTVLSSTKTTGSWNISTNTIGKNSTTYYSKPDGSKFAVASTEYIEMRVKPTTVRGFEVGYTGTSEGVYDAYVERAGQTAVIAFIDEITVPGTYKTFIRNISSVSSLTVSGSVEVLKR